MGVRSSRGESIGGNRSCKPAARDGFPRIALEDLAGQFAWCIWCLAWTRMARVRYRCGTMTTIMGYTEWVSEGMAEPVSLGWDWRLDRFTDR